MEAIRCEGLTKRFGPIAAVDSLGMVVEEGSVFGFLGRNGAGKTTTIKLLTALSKPTQGKAWVAGEEVVHNSLSLRRKIGYLPEEPSFYNWMSGHEFLTYVGELFRLPSGEIKRRTGELLNWVDLEEAASRRIGGYSKGMRQRLGIAQALMNSPEVLFLDEPASGLDPMGRRDVLEAILRLKGETTVFMSTHILSDVERVCDVVGIIDRGRLVTQSRMEELRQRYAHSVFELEFEEPTDSFLDSLRPLSWVSKVEELEPGAAGLRVVVNDLATAKRELLERVAQSELTLLRYELTLPSLEDVFIELVNNEGN